VVFWVWLRRCNPMMLIAPGGRRRSSVEDSTITHPISEVSRITLSTGQKLANTSLSIVTSFFTNRIISKSFMESVIERSPFLLTTPTAIANLRKVHGFYDKPSLNFSLMEEMLRSLQETPNVSKKRLNGFRRKGLRPVRETRLSQKLAFLRGIALGFGVKSPRRMDKDRYFVWQLCGDR
jgi:hypothetical protein